MGACGDCRYWEEHLRPDPDRGNRRKPMEHEGDCTVPLPSCVKRRRVGLLEEGCPLWVSNRLREEEA